MGSILITIIIVIGYYMIYCSSFHSFMDNIRILETVLEHG